MIETDRERKRGPTWKVTFGVLLQLLEDPFDGTLTILRGNVGVNALVAQIVYVRSEKKDGIYSPIRGHVRLCKGEAWSLGLTKLRLVYTKMGCCSTQCPDHIQG